ncbi:F0F1 ATP synthase subunit epsilon [Streptomyces alkaliterrae]|uniref:ATP synthase epsilon chain n=1 Tax=Streptomyces alkaliterrae TaxID=2213162 RepID=A0A5P0YWM7_9ACTN|nr:F0F1 ATP synthase subunit epsilon [Streptomyces alkaliterrae]MBB1253012.1 F0F1 ATP synthase subunit epsilon [Streptomyces alkaliterrae]MBB1257521.1 F0F1 ATP synthase subunit epsilon [Streptomyces alkaliterrae]MQS04685.1 F0F1 ATP synthase subunit epsilon [Streptomyces alkaliterrae]
MAELHVELVAADRKVWSGKASLVVARTSSGEIGIMPGHQPLLGVLASGPVTIRTTGEGADGAAGKNGTVIAAVHGGFISFSDNKLSLLTEIAELSYEIDVERAERALENAKAEQDAAAERRADVRLRAVAVAH